MSSLSAPVGRVEALARRLPVGLLALAACGLALTAQAATYYVDRSHPAASDANPGSEALPWLTIQHAADTLVAGDTVLVKAGTYPEQVTVTSAGAPGQEIVFAAYPGHTVTVDGSTLSLGEYEGLFQLVGASYVRVRGFHVTNTGPLGTNTGIQVDPGSHIVIESNHTSLTASSGILVWSSSDVLIDGNEVERTMTTGAASRNECITVGRTTRFEVRNNHVHDGSPLRGEGICLKDGSTSGSAHHNHIHHVASVGIYVDAWTEHTHDIDVYSNRIHDVDGSGVEVASEQGGLLEHVRVYNNLSYHNRHTGLTVSDCCIALHPMSDIQVVNNSIWGNGWTSWGGGIANGNNQAAGILVRNNVVAGNLSFEIAFEGIDPSGATLDHNLIDGWDGYPGELCGTACQIGDPLFVDTAAANFHLQRSSPGIDNGTALNAPARDYDRVRRPQDGNDDGSAVFDIGAYELPPSDYIFGDGFESVP
ncbi:MAG TPA: right-handed parallel beta-helix repeat-containing protein [Vicinamibacteria bacterium]|nr:right-handed parallel beta-helix repeat-containing protein [Vicinamibacteria bacterium]